MARCGLGHLARIDFSLIAGRIGRSALDLLLPPHCPACEQRIATDGLLCGACFGRTDFITLPCCDRCGLAFAAEGPLICEACDAAPPIFRRARGAMMYDAQARQLVLPFKHADAVSMARVLAAMMARAGRDLLRQTEVLVPVPLHRRRLFQRRYNQAALLAGAIGQTSALPSLPDALRRTRATESLDGKSAAERATEVTAAITVHPGRRALLQGRQVLLIDDVMTSGATANACAAALLDAGAVAVDVLVAARVPVRRLAEQTEG